MKPFSFDIPLAKKWQKVQVITKGWSSDEKYYIQGKEGQEFLLRISDKESLNKEQKYYAALEQLNAVNILAPKLLHTGLCNNQQNTFRLFTWIKGIELQEHLTTFSTAEQYRLGLQAGKLLRQIHGIHCPKDQVKWANHYNKKIDLKIERFKNCGIHLAHSDTLIAFIQTYRSLIIDRPQCFHHGDFHVGNMLLTPQQAVAVIDFNRLDFGDPWEEFNRITWSASMSPAFASGQIDGYFEDKVPDVFFQLIALYIGVNQLGSIPWAIDYGEAEVKTILAQTAEVFAWYDNFSTVKPKWYNKSKTW